MMLHATRGILQLRMHYQFRDWHMEKTMGTFEHNRSVYLRVSNDGEKYRFEYSEDGQTYQQLDAVDCGLLTPEVTGHEGQVVMGFHGFQGSFKYAAGRNWFEVDDVEYQLY
jgi:beta-xylosidase